MSSASLDTSGQPRRDGLPADLAAALAGGGEMGRRIEAFDWAASPLGTGMADWPAALRHAVATLLNSRKPIVLFWGPQRVTFYNDAYIPSVGAKHPAFLGCPGAQLWSEIWDVLGPLLDGVVSSGRAYWGTDYLFLLQRHGFREETYFDISYDPVRADDGSVCGVFCIVSETTGRVVGERRVRALAELGSRLTGLRGGEELGREAARVLAGHRNDVPFALLYLDGSTGDGIRLVGASGLDVGAVLFRGPADHLALPRVLATVFTSGAPVKAKAADFVVEPPDLAASEALVLPVTAATEPVGALVVGVSRRLALGEDYRNFLDLVAAQISAAVTVQRAYEHERARAAELAVLDQAKTNFFANISHEFRTPLTLILGPLEDLLADQGITDKHHQTLATIHRNGLRLLKLVNTVLDFSRIESGRLEATFQPTDLADYTSRLAATFRSAVEHAGLRLMVDCPPLPAPVHVDRDMWEKIVLNLLSNALKFTFTGGITVRLRSDAGEARLDVVDTGVGIEAGDLPHVFERFHRAARTRSRTHEGSGIGLALVRELTGMHGGTVTVDSQSGQGSTFTVRIPFGTAHLPAHQVNDSGPAEETSGSSRLYTDEAQWWTAPEPSDGQPTAEDRHGERGGRVLVVDDNADLRDHVTRLLSPYWDVTAVPDGTAAFHAAVDTPFDLVLTDVMMPRLDGVGLVTRLRADSRTRHVPIIMLTARAGPLEAVGGLAAGADDYLVKPFIGQELIARVRANVELGQLRGQTIRQLRALADAAVAINTARSTADVLRVAAQHAQGLVNAGRVVATAAGNRYEVDGGGRSPADPSVAVPLVGDSDERLGELRIWPRRGSGSATEQTMLGHLARLVGVRLENAQLYETEHRIATTLQHSFLPESLARLPGALVAGRYLPGNSDVEVGGDWYDVIEVNNQQLMLVIGDVVGKGVPAAATMGQLRNALRAYALEGYQPGEVLTRLNRLVASGARRAFATVVCLLFDPATGDLCFASAGHPAPFMISPEGVVAMLHEQALGPPVGAVPGAAYPLRRTRLAPGHRLLLYTDGLIEDRRIGIDAGLAQLRVAAAVSCDHVEDLVDRMLGRISGRIRRDDVAVLALEATEPHRFELRLPADPTKLTVLRRRLEDFLTAHRVGEADLFDLTVAVSEAAANAIEHPVAPRQATIDVEVLLAGNAVTVTVRDSGRWREASGTGFRGRGLALIGALGELAVNRTETGTEVVLRRRLSAVDPT